MIDEVVTSVFNRVATLALAIGGNPVAVVKGKQPRQQAGETANVQLEVHPAQRPHGSRQLDTVNDLHNYHVQTTLWKPGNQNNTANAADYSAIDHAIIAALNTRPSELAGLGDGLYDVSAQTGQYVDRGAFVKGWDVQQINVLVQIVRAR